MRPDAALLFEALGASWPPLAERALGPFTLRDGDGGGRRVSAATVAGEFSPAEFARALDAVARMDAPAFRIGPGSARLDAALAARGWEMRDPTAIRLGATDALGQGPSPAVREVWPPSEAQRRIWEDSGIGPARQRVMARAAGPRTSLLGLAGEDVAGTAFAALHGRIVFLHALEVAPRFRRQGVARNLVRAAARWGLRQDPGAGWLALAVTRANEPANRLYAALGMAEVAGYHYRVPPGGAA